MVPVSSTSKRLQEARLAKNRATLLHRENKIKEAERREELLDQQNRAQLAEKLRLAEITSRHGRERYAEELAILKAESEIDKARILAEDDDQLLGDVEEEHLSLVCDRVAISPKEKVTDFINSLTGNTPKLDEAPRFISIQSREDQFAHANNVYPELPYGPLCLAASLLKPPLSALQYLQLLNKLLVYRIMI